VVWCGVVWVKSQESRGICFRTHWPSVIPSAEPQFLYSHDEGVGIHSPPPMTFSLLPVIQGQRGDPGLQELGHIL
jgi:hypothetical protein